MLVPKVLIIKISFSLVSKPQQKAPSIVSELWDHGGLMFWECQQLMRDIVLLESCSSSIEVNKPSVN